MTRADYIQPAPPALPEPSMRRLCCSLALLLVPLAASAAAPPARPDRVIFDFEGKDDAAAWSNLSLPKVKEPPIKVARAAEHATSGKHSLKLTFAGGSW